MRGRMRERVASRQSFRSVFGAGYADIRATLPANRIMMVATLVVAAIVVASVFLRRTLLIAASALAIWFLAGVGATSFYPSLVQRFQVSPNELGLERPYIGQNILYTRLAYALDGIESRSYDATQQLTASGLLQQPDTLRHLVLDELLTNIVSYGYDDGLTHEISLRLRAEPGSLTAILRDDGKPFNPLEEAPAAVLDGSIEDRPIGGLGIHFMRTLMDEVTYQRQDGYNQLILIKHLSAREG